MNVGLCFCPEVLLKGSHNLQFMLEEDFGKTSIVILLMQKRRSNRQVKRKKYAEEGEGKQSEEEAKVSVKMKKNPAPLPAEQPLQLFVVSENWLGL